VLRARYNTTSRPVLYHRKPSPSDPKLQSLLPWYISRVVLVHAVFLRDRRLLKVVCYRTVRGIRDGNRPHPGGLRTSEGVRRLLKYHSSGSNVMEGLWRGELRVRLAIFNHQGESEICWFVWLHSPDFCESPHLC